MKHLKILLAIIFLLIPFGCAERETETKTETVYVKADTDAPDYVTLSSFGSKGPCDREAVVIALPLYDDFSQIGPHFIGSTKTNTGYWEVPAQVTSKFTEAGLEGYCMSELSGVSILQKIKAIFYSNSEHRHINALTTIAVDVIRWVYANQAIKDNDQAMVDAEVLVAGVFGFTGMKPFSAILLNDGDTDAARLAIASSIILQARSNQSAFMTEISQAIIIGDVVAIKVELAANMALLPIAKINENLKTRYLANNSTWTYPPMHTVAGLPDYYDDLLNNEHTLQISHNLELTGSCSFDQSTFNIFTEPIVFDAEIVTSKYFISDHPKDAQISIWTKGISLVTGLPIPGTKVQDLTTLREVMIKTPLMSYNGMFDLAKMPEPNTEYMLVIRKDTPFVLSRNCSGPALPFGQVNASKDNMVNWLGPNTTDFFTRDSKYGTAN